MSTALRDAQQPNTKVILLLIDPQLDFHDTLAESAATVHKIPKTPKPISGQDPDLLTKLAPAVNGSLKVNGSAVDSVAISDMIMTHMKDIDEIYVTLDTHHVNHIGHAAFWWKGEGDKKTG